MTFKENTIIVGNIDEGKFKLRNPRTADKVKDTREIERGIVCDTKNRHELMKLAASLSISMSNMDRVELTIKKLCLMIREKLMALEIKERTKNGRTKYVYMWWDD